MGDTVAWDLHGICGQEVMRLEATPGPAVCVEQPCNNLSMLMTRLVIFQKKSKPFSLAVRASITQLYLRSKLILSYSHISQISFNCEGQKPNIAETQEQLIDSCNWRVQGGTTGLLQAQVPIHTPAPWILHTREYKATLSIARIFLSREILPIVQND